MTPDSGRRFRYGLLLPHFGSQARRDRLTTGITKIEGMGFDSVWVRDHVVYHPHDHEDQDRTHLDPFIVLTAAAALSKSLLLGSATLIPHRHPVHAAGLLAALDFIAGKARVIAGFGIGNYDHEFEAVGMGGWDRRDVIEEYVAILRGLWTGDPMSHHGRYYQFDDVEMRPVPSTHLPIWYGGGSPAAVRRAVEYCDGWLPSRIPYAVFAKRMRRMSRLASEAGRRAPDVGIVPLVVVAKTVEEGVRRLNLDALLSATNQIYGSGLERPASSYSDLDGVAMVGPPDLIAQQVEQFQSAGADHVVFDLRATFEGWEDATEELAATVLPLLPRT